MEKRKVILDVDTGSDDACAIMLAALSNKIDLVAICSVNGNVPIANTTENSLRVVDLLKMDIPVYKGAASPLVRDVCPWRIHWENRADAIDENGNTIHIHQEYLDLPISKRKPQDKCAANFYVDYLMSSTEKITICAVGPLTNLALALMLEPKIVEHIEEIVIMGGCWNVSNATNCAEFNIFVDPEAAQRVLNCGAKITLVPLDATHKGCVNIKDVEKLREINTPASRFAADLCQLRILVHDQQQPLEPFHSCALHDALAVAYIIDPTVLLDVKHVYVSVSLSANTDGQTIVDQRYFQKNRNCYFAFDADREKFVNILFENYKLSK